MNLKKMERYLRVNLLGPGPRLMKKRIYLAAVSQMLRNTAVEYWEFIDNLRQLIAASQEGLRSMEVSVQLVN